MADEAENPRAVAGNNNPPEPTPFETSKTRVDHLIATANLWSTERPKIEDAETAKKCDGFLTQITGELKAVKAQHKADKQPHIDAGSAVDAQYKPLVDLLEKVKSILNPRMAVWLQEQDHIAAQKKRAAEAEARRLADEAAAALAVANAAKADVIQAAVAADRLAEDAKEAAKKASAMSERTAVKHDFSARSRSLRTTYYAEITDLDECYVHYVNSDKSAQIEALLKSFADADIRGGAGRDGKPGIPGCLVQSRQSAS